MEHLTKQQIILLTLLVSFVSSIATGIVTVSLLEQTPPAVTQTINRVVERTIERVSPSATTTKETIIVKDDQATIAAIAKASKALVRIYTDGAFSAIGVLATSGGRIVASVTGPLMVPITGRFEGGNIVPLAFISKDPETGLSIFQADQPADPRNARVYMGASFADEMNAKLGQSIVSISGDKSPIVATGIISSIDDKGIKTSIQDPDFDSQAILVNLLGEILGMKGSSTENAYISSTDFKLN